VEVVHIDDVDPDTLAKWNAIEAETTLAMQDHCMRYVTPISEAVENEWGLLEGTGGYVGFGEKRLLMTNEHVIKDWKTRQFCHQFHGCDDVFKLGEPLALEKHPVDIAIYQIGDKVWRMRAHSAEIVPPERIAAKHQPAAGELLFFAGYPEKRSRSFHKLLISRAIRLVTQERRGAPIPGLHPNYFSLIYNPERARSVDQANTINLCDPHGLSGSLVWNTRRVECSMKGRPWSPDLAQVTGMICRWDSPTSTVSAVRIEVILDFLTRYAA
jgi:hypothetical protein